MANTYLSFLATADDYTLTNGWYGTNASTLGLPSGISLYGALLVAGYDFRTLEGARLTQTFHSVVVARVYTRFFNGTAWNAWVEITRPTMAGKARKPLTPGDADTGEEWSDTLSIPKYIDKMFTGNGTGTCVLNLSTASVWDFTLTGNATFTLSNMPSLSGESLTLVIRVRQASAPKTVTWFAGITWLTYGGLVPPTPGANQIIEYVLSTTGTGTTWVGRVGAST